jgi:DNA-binding NarL/FixJ family response regulator
MKYNSVIIASNADFLADVLRDRLRDCNTGPVLTAHNENELLTGIKNRCPRFVFLENCFRGQGTEEFILRMVKQNDDVRIAVWSSAAVKPVIAARFIFAGAESYFSLRDTDENITGILNRIVTGRRYYPAEVKTIIESNTYVPDMDGTLTMREIEIIKLSITGQSNQEIADVLGIRVSTVKLHKVNIYRKCGGNTPVDILRYGLMQGVIRLEDLGGGA